jgi:hypothetical protein
VETCQGDICPATAALDCNDGDACTIDRCDPASGCTHAKAAGAAGILCGLEQGLGITACADQPLPRGVGRQVERAKVLIRQASGPESLTKPLVKAGKKLRRAKRLVARAARAGKLGGPCADALRGVLDQVRAEIAGVVTSRREV